MYHKGNKHGFKRGKISFSYNQNMEIVKNNPYPIDPNKPTLRMLTINFGDETPPEMAEVAPLHEVLREKYNIQYVTENPDIILDGFLPKHQIPEYPNAIKIFYTSEVYLDKNPDHFIDKYDLVMGFDFINADNYIRLPFQYVSFGREKVRHDYKRNQQCSPSSKKYFACFLVSNSGEWMEGKFDGAKVRIRMFHKLSLYKNVLSGGKHLNNIGGPAKDAIEFLSQCKFTIAYENTLNYPGYITEKPFNAWAAGTIPIYNAHPDGLVDLNKKSIIYAGDFPNEEELINYIIKVDNDDKLYCDIWNQQIIDNPDNDYNKIKDKIRVKIYQLLKEKNL